MEINERQMNLLHIMTDISPEYIAEAAEPVLTPRRMKVISAIAAVLAVVLLIGGFVWNRGGEMPEIQVSLLTVLEDGTYAQLQPMQSQMSVAGNSSAVFDGDEPMFALVLRPADQDDWQITEEYSLTVLYDSSDDRAHIFIGHLQTTSAGDTPNEYCIYGWFLEATDIKLVLSDAKSGKTVSEITVNIVYCPDTGMYQLTYETEETP